MKLIFLAVMLLGSFAPAYAQANKLSSAQIDQIKKIKADTEKRAAPLALGLAETTKKIYANMLADKEDAKLRKRLAKDLHRYAGGLLDIKGQSFRDILAVLTPEQKQLVRAEMQKPDAPADIAEVVVRVFELTEK